MIHAVDRDEVQRLVNEQGALVAEVLPRAEYDWAHLAGATHLPLKGWEIEKVQGQFERERPVIVYCNNFQ